MTMLKRSLMRKISLLGSMLLVTLGQASNAATTVASPAVFAFKGSSLGDQLSVWRERPAPTESFPNVEPICLGDAAAPKNDRRSPAQVSAQVVECGYSAPHATTRYWSGGRIGGSEYTSADYFFLNDRLYQVEVVGVIDGEPEIVRLLSAKYGAPKTEKTTSLNGTGTSIPVTTYLWQSPSGRMVLTAPAMRIDRFTLVLTDKAAEAAVQRADQAARPDNEKI